MSRMLRAVQAGVVELSHRGAELLTSIGGRHWRDGDPTEDGGSAPGGEVEAAGVTGGAAAIATRSRACGR